MMATGNEIVVYQPNETIRLDVRLENETVWLSQAQMVLLFQRDQSVVARHISHVFNEGEVDKESNMHFLHIPFSDKPVAFYSLDVIISVGYRIKSMVGTRFRQWATRILRDHLLRSVSENARLASLERRVDEGFERQGQRIRRLENEVSVFVKTALPPVEGVLFEGQKLQLDLSRYNAQYAPIAVKPYNGAHDRFIILDGETVYHVGASLKDLGQSLFAFSRLQIPASDILLRLP